MWTLQPSHRLTVAATHTEAGQGGIARVSRLSVRALQRAGHEVRVRALHNTAASVINGVPAAASAGNRWHFMAGLQRDVLNSDAMLFDHAGPVRARPRVPKRPLIVWMHGVEVWGDALSPGRRAALEAADLVLVNSHYTLARFQADHFALANARVVHLGTEEDDALSAAQPATLPVALCVGRVDKANMRKGHVEVVKAWPKVVAKVPQARLLVAGGGDGLTDLQALAAESSAAASIEILGFVPEPEMPALWQSAAIYVQPSWKEGFGLTYIEAMRHGLPVVASKNDAGQEVNADGVSGFNVDLQTPTELSDAVSALFDNAARRAALAKGAQQRWNDRFRFSQFAERFMAALRGDPPA